MKVAIIDIDGCLSEYPHPLFFKFVKTQTGTVFNSKEEIVNRFGRLVYNDIKNSFRRSGLKLDYDVRKGAAHFIGKLKELGFVINIVTSRPALKENIHFTELWLEKNKIYYDQLLFIKSKGSLIVSNTGLQKLLVIDDEYEGLMDYIGKPNTVLIKFGKNNPTYSSINHVNNWEDVMPFLR